MSTIRRLRDLIAHARAGHRIAAFLLTVFVVIATVGTADGHTPKVREARQYAREHVNKGQWRCLDRLIEQESGWSIHGVTPKWASPRKGAYGLGQALPGRKMRSAQRPQWGPKWDSWLDDGLVQISWVIYYIRSRYGTMCHAYSFQLRWRFY